MAEEVNELVPPAAVKKRKWPLLIGGLVVFALCLFILVDGARMVPVQRALPALKSRMSQGREKGALHG